MLHVEENIMSDGKKYAPTTEESLGEGASVPCWPVSDKPPVIRLLRALNAAQAEFDGFVKDKTNSFHKYNYTSAQQVADKIRGILVRHKLLLLPYYTGYPTDEHGNTRVFGEYTLYHSESGEMIESKLAVTGVGNDKNSKGVGDKGINKALTAANKYMLFLLFQTGSGDDPEKPNALETESRAEPIAKVPVFYKLKATIEGESDWSEAKRDKAQSLLDAHKSEITPQQYELLSGKVKRSKGGKK